MYHGNSPEDWCDNDREGQPGDHGVHIPGLGQGHQAGPGAVVTNTNQQVQITARLGVWTWVYCHSRVCYRAKLFRVSLLDEKVNLICLIF